MLFIFRVPTIYRKRVDVNDEKTLSLRSGNDPVVFEVLLKSTPNTYAIHGWDNSSFMLSYILMYEMLLFRTLIDIKQFIDFFNKISQKRKTFSTA